MNKILICFIYEIMQTNQTVLVEYDVCLPNDIKTNIRVLDLNIWDFIGDLLIESEIKTESNRQDIILIIPTNKTDGKYYSECVIKALLNCQLKTKIHFFDLRQFLFSSVALKRKEPTYEEYYTDVT